MGMKNSTTNYWTHKVVKSQRGMNGEWFRYRAATTTRDVGQAIAYARRFAAAQAGVAGTKILVVQRKGNRVVHVEPVV